MPKAARTNKEQSRRYDTNKSSIARYGFNYRRWRRIRRLHLIQNPLCVECLKKGRILLATTVDHIDPHRGDAVKFYDKKNLQSLCTSHHNQKSGREKYQG